MIVGNWIKLGGILMYDFLAPLKYNLIDEIEKFATDDDKKALIICSENGDFEQLTYKQLLELSYQTANVFKAHGLKKGDRLLIMLPRCLWAYTAYIGALKLGLIVVPCSDQLRAHDIDYRIRHAQASVIVLHEDYIEHFGDIDLFQNLTKFIVRDHENDRNALNVLVKEADKIIETVEINCNDTAFISYTSGTTGTPKGAIHHHAWGYAHIRTTAKYWLGVQSDDIVWATAAPGWQKWIWSPFLATLGSGATAFVYKGKFNANTYLHLIEKFAINVLCCTPTEYRMMIKSDSFGSYEYTQLRSAVSAGEPLNREVIERFKERYHVLLRDGYGQTENTLLIGTLLNMDQKIGSMGKPTPGNKVDIIDGFGKEVPPGQVGDIAVHIETPALFKGYYREPERTAMQFRGDWYITGDRARKDEDGYFWFEGRADDMIISAGYTIGPFDIEDALLKHPLVQECAVVASPDEIRGNVVKAFIVLKDIEIAVERDIVKELQDYVKSVLAPYSYPRKIEFLEELPKTMSGKIRRTELRKREQQKGIN